MGVNLLSTDGVIVGIPGFVASTRMTLGPKGEKKWREREQRDSREIIKNLPRNCHDTARSHYPSRTRRDQVGNRYLVAPPRLVRIECHLDGCYD